MKSIQIKTVLGFLALFGSAMLTISDAATAERPDQSEPPALSSQHIAVLRSGDPQALRIALDAGLPVRGRDSHGNTPLMLAALYGTPASLGLLLERGADVNADNHAGANALMRAASDPAKLALLLRHRVEVNAQSKLGNTALILAARPAESYRAVKLLLDHGADAKMTNHFGASALMAAAAGGDSASVALLLRHGADPNVECAPGEPGFLFGGGRTALAWAAFRGHTAILKQLIAAGANVNTDNSLGTALAQAAWADQTEAARLLLRNGAAVNQAGQAEGYTALHWAAGTENRADSLVRLLLRHGADPAAAGGEPIEAFMGKTFTPVMLAELRGDTAILKTLTAAAPAAAAPAPQEADATTRPVSALPDLPERLHAVQVRNAISRAVPLLQETALYSKEAFVNHPSKQDCTSCHQQYLPMAALGLARKLDVAVDRAAEQRLHRIVEAGEFKEFEPDWQPLFHPDLVFTKGYALLGYALADRPADELTDAAVHHLSVAQGKDGRWYNNLPRPPLQTGDISATALAIHALKRYPLPGRRAEFAARVERARHWLWSARAENTDSRIFQILGLAWAGEPAHKLAPLARALIREQRADGGWGQLPALGSDAYATGQALYALQAGLGLSTSHRAIERGRQFLVRTQLADGTWRVRRRTFPFQPSMRSGFPHGRDSWISAAGSSWAVMALSLADPIQTTATRGQLWFH